MLSEGDRGRGGSTGLGHKPSPNAKISFGPTVIREASATMTTANMTPPGSAGLQGRSVLVNRSADSSALAGGTAAGGSSSGHETAALARKLLFEPTGGSPGNALAGLLGQGVERVLDTDTGGARVSSAEELRALAVGSPVQVQRGDGGQWLHAKVEKNNSTTKRHANMLKVSFDGLKSKHDEWISYDSGRLRLL